jgi:hypothetical protein
MWGKPGPIFCARLYAGAQRTRNRRVIRNSRLIAGLGQSGHDATERESLLHLDSR